MTLVWDSGRLLRKSVGTQSMAACGERVSRHVPSPLNRDVERSCSIIRNLFNFLRQNAVFWCNLASQCRNVHTSAVKQDKLKSYSSESWYLKHLSRCYQPAGTMISVITFSLVEFAKYYDRRVTVCVFVCLSVYLSALISQKPHAKFYQIFCTCHLWPWLGRPFTAVQYVMYFRFSGWRHVFT